MSVKGMVYVVDDDPSVRRSVCRLLESAHHASAAFASAQEFLAATPKPGASCLILDLRMPGLSGLELQEALIKAGRLLPIVFISAQGDISSSVSAMKAGAIDFLVKPFDASELLEAVRRALIKSVDLRRYQNQRRSLGNRRDRLTAREKQVFSLVVGGHLNKQIAMKLGISEKTVKVHRARVMEKMNAKSLADLVRMEGRFHLPALPTRV